METDVMVPEAAVHQPREDVLPRVHLHVSEAVLPVDTAVHLFPFGKCIRTGSHLVPDHAVRNLHVDDGAAVQLTAVGRLSALLGKEQGSVQRHPDRRRGLCNSFRAATGLTAAALTGLHRCHRRVKSNRIRVLIIQFDRHDILAFRTYQKTGIPIIRRYACLFHFAAADDYSLKKLLITVQVSFDS